MKKLTLTLFLFAFLTLATPAYANTTGYAWSESLGWFDFSNVVVSDTTVSGYAYNDNTGWLVLDGVTNTNGTLSGYAWSESVGWFDFSNVSISSGSFSGYAYNDNTGWLSFEDETTVTTSWAPAVDAPAPEPRRRSGGSSISSRVNNLIKNGNIQEAQELRAKFPDAPVGPVNIEDLQKVITSLQAQIADLLAKQGLSKIQTNTTFSQDLQINSEGEGVRKLQTLLIQKGYSIPAGATGYFGPQTQAALIQYQVDNSIEPTLGYFGPITRAIINK